MSMPEPLALINEGLEGVYSDKSLALWTLWDKG